MKVLGLVALLTGLCIGMIAGQEPGPPPWQVVENHTCLEDDSYTEYLENCSYNPFVGICAPVNCYKYVGLDADCSFAVLEFCKQFNQSVQIAGVQYIYMCEQSLDSCSCNWDELVARNTVPFGVRRCL